MKIIHTADIHLGARPDSSFPWADKRERSIWNTFRRLIERTAEEKPEMLVISGDLFDRPPSRADLAEVNYLFSLIPDTQVVLCAGNHDHITKTSPYPVFDWNKNVIGLWDKKCSSVSVPHLDTRVYGLSYHHYEAPENLYAGACRIGNEKYHILLFHGGDALHCPVNKSIFLTSGFDYIAMGHIHKSGYFIKNKAAYCGALEPIDASDMSKHGYLEVELKKGAPHVRFVDFAASIYDTIEISCDDMSWLELEDILKAEVKNRGELNSYRLVINTGNTSFQNLIPERLWHIGRFFDVVINNEKYNDTELLMKKYPGSFLAEYINALSDREDPAGKEALKKGVRVIMEAMENRS